MTLAPLLFFLFASPQEYRYWIEPCKEPATGCQAADPQLADWAMEAWQNSSRRLLRLTRVQNEQQAHIRLYWAGAPQGIYGEARPIMVDGKRGAEVYVRPSGPADDALLRDAIVYLTCLHETGHALGMRHTANFEDIMYTFQFGGDIPEYFGRYRRKLKSRADIPSNSGLSESDRARLIDLLSPTTP